MRVKGSYKPKNIEIEIIDSGKIVLMYFFENIQRYETEDESGYEFDRYELRHPYSEDIIDKVLADVALWRNFARQEEIYALTETVRNKRNSLLVETDWTQTLDAPISAKSREALRIYRQELRDITELPEFPYIERWPEMPVIEKDDPNPVDNAFGVYLVGESS